MEWEQLLPTINFANRIQILPNQHFGPRVNPDHQMICVHRGAGKIVISGRKYMARKGDFFCYEPKVMHKIEGDEQDPFLLSGIIFDLDRYALDDLGVRAIQVSEDSFSSEQTNSQVSHLQGILLNSSYIAEHINLPLNHRAFQLVDQLVKEYENGEEGSVWICRGIMIQLLGSLYRAVPLRAQKLNCHHYYSDLRSILKKLEVENLLQYQSVKDLANALGLSQSYFYAVFKESFGISPQTFLIQARVRLAKRLLKRGYSSMEKVAEDSGFGNIHYFSRVFRKVEGMTPATYRKKTQII